VLLAGGVRWWRSVPAWDGLRLVCRLCRSCELVTSPVLLFLDEPTSGLDSASAFYVMSTVRKLAEGCRTVLSVIHQPSSEVCGCYICIAYCIAPSGPCMQPKPPPPPSRPPLPALSCREQVYGLFDKLCLLSDGHVIYFGDADKATDMFTAAGLPLPPARNPADHFLMAINTDFESSDVERNIEKLASTYGTSRVAAAVSDRVAQLHGSPGACAPALRAPAPPACSRLGPLN
jgi:hypothetical protein